MHHQLVSAATSIASTSSGDSFHIGPWIIVPIVILLAIIGAPIYIVRDRRRRRAQQRTR
jgi:4-hydroxybenzoate polyprenyltransferase